MIQDGLLWFYDNPKRDLDDKIRAAARLYHKKFGHLPNVCYIHPADKHSAIVDGIKIVPYKTILPSHFWLANENRRKAR